MNKQSKSFKKINRARGRQLKVSSVFLGLSLSLYAAVSQAGERDEALALLARLLKEEQERQAQLAERDQVKAEENVEANIDEEIELSNSQEVDANFITELVEELDAESESILKSEYASLSGGQVYFVDSSSAKKSTREKLTEHTKEEAVGIGKDVVSDTATLASDSIVEQIKGFFVDNSTVIGGVAAAGVAVAVLNDQDDVAGGSILSAKVLMADLVALNKPGETENLFGTKYKLSSDVTAKMYEIMSNANGLGLLVEFGIDSWLTGQFDDLRVTEEEDTIFLGSFDKIYNDAVASLYFSQLYDMALPNHPVFGDQQAELAFLIADRLIGTHVTFNSETMIRAVEFVNLLAEDLSNIRDDYFADELVITSKGFNVIEAFDDALVMTIVPPLYANTAYGFGLLFVEVLLAAFVWDECDYKMNSGYGKSRSAFDEDYCYDLQVTPSCGQADIDFCYEYLSLQPEEIPDGDEPDASELQLVSDQDEENTSSDDSLSAEDSAQNAALNEAMVTADIEMSFKNPAWWNNGNMNLISFTDEGTTQGLGGSGVRSQYEKFIDLYFAARQLENVPTHLIEEEFQLIISLLRESDITQADIDTIAEGLLTYMESYFFLANEEGRLSTADYYAKLTKVASGLDFELQDVIDLQNQFSKIFEANDFFLIWNLTFLLANEGDPCESGRNIASSEQAIKDLNGLQIYLQEEDNTYNVYEPDCDRLEAVTYDSSLYEPKGVGDWDEAELLYNSGELKITGYDKLDGGNYVTIQAPAAIGPGEDEFILKYTSTGEFDWQASSLFVEDSEQNCDIDGMEGRYTVKEYIAPMTDKFIQNIFIYESVDDQLRLRHIDEYTLILDDEGDFVDPVDPQDICYLFAIEQAAQDLIEFG